jgi:Uma2 family endonuclease
MPTKPPRILVEMRYYEAAQEYLRSLPPEHFMEATPQATQRKITLESLDLVHEYRPEVQHFNELLVQYPLPRRKRPGQVVPDNMIVVHDEPIKAIGSFDVPLQPVRPFCVMEYVSKSNRRKDYDESMFKYEHELKVPYYLLFVPEEQELTLYRHKGERYASLRPDKHGRYPIAEIDVAVRLHDGWVRYWYKGKLVPLPAELLVERNEALAERNEARRRAEAAEREAAELRAEIERRRQHHPDKA